MASFVTLHGQFNTGLILDDDSYKDVPNVSDQIEIQSGQKFIPRKVNLTRFCPPIRHQGDISSCVGWSAGYGAMTIERAIQNGWTDKEYIAEQANSALFVYNQISNASCEGIRMPDALELIQEKGNCLARDFDFDVNDCSKQAEAELFEQAQAHRLEDYIRLFDS